MPNAAAAEFQGPGGVAGMRSRLVKAGGALRDGRRGQLARLADSGQGLKRSRLAQHNAFGQARLQFSRSFAIRVKDEADAEALKGARGWISVLVLQVHIEDRRRKKRCVRERKRVFEGRSGIDNLGARILKGGAHVERKERVVFRRKRARELRRARIQDFGIITRPMPRDTIKHTHGVYFGAGQKKAILYLT